MAGIDHLNGAPGAPAALGPYSQAAAAGPFVFLAGQIGVRPDGGMDDGFEAQAQQCFANLAAVCKHAGGGLDGLLKLNVYVTDVANFAAFNAVAEQHLSAPYPARALVGVAALPKGALVELEGVLHLPGRPAA
ncbi:MAG: RidA family protein [Betaproteobacteria bacterium AqS2]|uniref:RidA family protein n=1 Tax=Candidatus Amphirhobacter heronislandensis TaxID=1732024 RepID=A0A930UI39_9GAMM|nr:RidA family protein [Betaproteobacteria bacterium AqS2]